MAVLLDINMALLTEAMRLQKWREEATSEEKKESTTKSEPSDASGGIAADREKVRMSPKDMADITRDWQEYDIHFHGCAPAYG